MSYPGISSLPPVFVKKATKIDTLVTKSRPKAEKAEKHSKLPTSLSPSTDQEPKGPLVSKLKAPPPRLNAGLPAAESELVELWIKFGTMCGTILLNWVRLAARDQRFVALAQVAAVALFVLNYPWQSVALMIVLVSAYIMSSLWRTERRGEAHQTH